MMALSALQVNGGRADSLAALSVASGKKKVLQPTDRSLARRLIQRSNGQQGWV